MSLVVGRTVFVLQLVPGYAKKMTEVNSSEAHKADTADTSASSILIKLMSEFLFEYMPSMPKYTGDAINTKRLHTVPSFYRC